MYFIIIIIYSQALLLLFQTQIHELKQSHNPTAAKLRNMLLDPAVNLMFERMKKEVESCKEKLEQAQNDLAAWKFTPDRYGASIGSLCRGCASGIGVHFS